MSMCVCVRVVRVEGDQQEKETVFPAAPPISGRGGGWLAFPWLHLSPCERTRHGVGGGGYTKIRECIGQWQFSVDDSRTQDPWQPGTDAAVQNVRVASSPSPPQRCLLSMASLWHSAQTDLSFTSWALHTCSLQGALACFTRSCTQ